MTAAAVLVTVEEEEEHTAGGDAAAAYNNPADRKTALAVGRNASRDHTRATCTLAAVGAADKGFEEHRTIAAEAAAADPSSVVAHPAVDYFHPSRFTNSQLRSLPACLPAC